MRVVSLVAIGMLSVPVVMAAQGTIIPRPCPEDRPCSPIVQGAIQRTSSQVRVELADRVLRYQITETFRNRGGLIGEADYIFPMPAGAAFEALELEIDGELVSGETMPADQAVSSRAISSNAATYASMASFVWVTESVHSSSRPGVMKMPRFML